MAIDPHETACPKCGDRNIENEDQGDWVVKSCRCGWIIALCKECKKEIGDGGGCDCDNPDPFRK